jgi:molybdate transport system substrate-binding protein
MGKNIMTMLYRLLLAGGVLWLMTSAAAAATVTVFAAASLTDALKDLAAAYEHQSEDKIVFNFAASGVLSRQIEAGAPADLIFFADEAHADGLERKGLLVSGTRQDVLGNALVIITTPDHAAMASPTELTNAVYQHVALGEVKTVPCGAYAKIYLTQQGLWPVVAPKVIPFDNVRAVLAAVETGNVDAGVVYATDALISQKVKVAYAIPAADGPKINYPLALLKDAPEPAAAQKFAAFLESGVAATGFKKYGFLAPCAVTTP